MVSHRRAAAKTPRDLHLNIRVSAQERDELRARAVQAGLSVGAFMVDRALIEVTRADLARAEMAARRQAFEDAGDDGPP